MDPMDDLTEPTEPEPLALPRLGDPVAFGRLMTSHRGELYSGVSGRRWHRTRTPRRLNGRYRDSTAPSTRSWSRTSHPPAPIGPWSDALVVRRAAAAGYLADLKNQDGGDILIFGSRTLWNALLTDGLVDELHLMIGPVALGAGTALFVGQPEVSLGLIDGPRMWNG
jgi:hypothetical protein